jgi:hypothetical protein
MIFAKHHISYNKKADQPSTIYLPSGKIQILLNHAIGKCPTYDVCFFTREKTQCACLDMSFIPTNVCADIIITMKEMGYDFMNKNQFKKAKKEDKERILNKYKELLEFNPELFKECDSTNGSDSSEDFESLALSKLENFDSLHHNLTQSVSKKYKNNIVNLNDHHKKLKITLSVKNLDILEP